MQKFMVSRQTVVQQQMLLHRWLGLQGNTPGLRSLPRAKQSIYLFLDRCFWLKPSKNHIQISLLGAQSAVGKRKKKR